MGLNGKKAVILVENLYNDLEFWYPYYRLKEEGVEVTVVGPQAGIEYTGKSGLKARADKGMTEVTKETAAAYHALIIPGGYAPDRMRRHPTMVDLVRIFHQAGKPVAAICHAGWMLASADIVRGKRVTGFFSIRDDLIHADAAYVDEEVVEDGNLITSRKPDDLPAFMKAIIRKMKE
jgi:protease I